MELVIHRGAGDKAPENSWQALEWAMIHHPQRIELDLLEHQVQIWLCHDPKHWSLDCPLLSEAEEKLRASDLKLMLDLKSYGRDFAQRVGEVFQDQAWQDRILITGHSLTDTVLAASLITGAQAGWSLPQIDFPEAFLGAPESHDHMLWQRDQLPGWIREGLADSDCDFLSLQYELLSPELFAVCQDLGLGVYAWTATSKDHLDGLRQMPLAGIVSDTYPS